MTCQRRGIAASKTHAIVIPGSFLVECWHGPRRSQADALGPQSRKSRSPFAASCPSPIKHIREQFCLSQSRLLPNPSPSSAKLIQIKMLGFTWFYSSDSGLINGLQRFQIRIFSSPLRLIAKPRLARRAFGSDNRHNVGRLLIFTRCEAKNRIVSGFLFRPPLRLHPARSRRHRSKQQLTQ